MLRQIGFQRGSFAAVEGSPELADDSLDSFPVNAIQLAGGRVFQSHREVLQVMNPIDATSARPMRGGEAYTRAKPSLSIWAGQLLEDRRVARVGAGHAGGRGGPCAPSSRAAPRPLGPCNRWGSAPRWAGRLASWSER